MDDARRAIAVAALGCPGATTTRGRRAGTRSPSAPTTKGGTTKGGTTKGGTLAAEAVVFFNPAGSTDTNRSAPTTSGAPITSVAGELDMAALHRRRKRAGHELSKSRFVAAQILAYFEPELGLWRRSAVHSNECAARLARGLEAERESCGVEWGWQHPVETNQLFLSFPVRSFFFLAVTVEI
jgi:threonine aldolase